MFKESETESDRDECFGLQYRIFFFKITIKSKLFY